jgi:hypothetical protein
MTTTIPPSAFSLSALSQLSFPQNTDKMNTLTTEGADDNGNQKIRGNRKNEQGGCT